MSSGHRKGVTAFAFVLFVSAPTQGSSPAPLGAAGAVSCLRALLPQPQSGQEARGGVPSEVFLAPQYVGSYGWVTGQLIHPVHATCLARDPHLPSRVAFRPCDGADRMQLWQWKAKGDLSGAVVMSVLQHQFTGMVLERGYGVGRGDVFGLSDYRVGADSQRFSLRACNS